MKKVLIAYDSRTGKTRQMAEDIAEGVRFSGNEAEVRKITDIKNEKELQGYDGYLFGSPTYYRDMIGSMKMFLFLAQVANLGGKVGGAFGSYTHIGDAPKLIFDTMENVFKMDMVIWDRSISWRLRWVPRRDCGPARRMEKPLANN